MSEHPEQNTQRQDICISGCCPVCGEQIGHFDWCSYYVKPLPSPAPQTEAGDVPGVIEQLWQGAAGSGLTFAKIQTAIAPLTQRIAELQAENERLKALLHESVAQELPRVEEVQPA